MRLLSPLLAAPLIFACGHAFAQGGDLAGVTMRVLDDLSGIDAVVLELAPAAQGAGAAEGRGERQELREPEDGERREGRVEDEDVEPAAPQPPA